MSARATLLLLLLLLPALPGCGREAQPAELAVPLAPGTPQRFAGLLVLEGRLAQERTGVLWLSARPLAGGRAVLQRGWDLSDPAWFECGSARALYFGLDAADAASGPRLAQLRAEMQLEARLDPDGKLGTEEAGVVRGSWRVPTGATDLALRLAPARPAVGAEPQAAEADPGTSVR